MLREKVTESLKAAMMAKNEGATSTCRMINAAIKQKDIDVARPRGDQQISEEEILNLLQGLIKQRKESIALYQQGGRKDLAEKEQAEVSVIEGFLPKQLSEDEIRAAAKDAISAQGAAGIKDMGKVMGVIKGKYAGQMDMGKASAIVKELLSAA
jgi:uncharacterized protein YqeY